MCWRVVCLCFTVIAEVVKMEVRVELMVVKGSTVYLVLVKMKYNPTPHSCMWQCVIVVGLGHLLTSES